MKKWLPLVIILFALILRLPHLNGSFWLDEAAQVLESARPLNQQLMIRDDFQPPLIHLLVHGLLKVSESEWWLRTGAALIPGLVTIGAVLWIGKILDREKLSQLAAVFLATSSFHIFYSQELRPYSLPVMFCVLGWAIILKLIEQKKIDLQWLTGWVVCSIFGLYSLYLYPFALFGQVVFLGWSWRQDRRRLAQLAAGTFAIGLGFLPWVPYFLGQVEAGQDLRLSLPGWESVVSYDQIKSLILIVGKFIFGILDLSLHPLFIGSYVLFAGSLAFLKWQVWQKRAQVSQYTTFVTMIFCWIFVPIMTAWVVSFWIPVIQPKRVMFALPAFYLGVSWLVFEGFSQAKKIPGLSFRRAAAITSAVLLFCFNAFSTFSYYTNPKYQREDWREMHRYISEKYFSHESVALFAFPDAFASWEWYNRDSQYPTAATGVLVVSAEPEAADRIKLKGLTRYRYILVFDYLRDLTDPQRIIEQDLERYGYSEVDRITPTTPLGIVRVYAQTRQIIGSATYSDGIEKIQ